MSAYFQSYVANTKKPAVTDQATSGANAAVAVTLVGQSRKRHYVLLVLWSYSGTPTGGRLTISGLDPTSDTVDFDITASGPGPITLPPLMGGLGENVVVTLAAGGAGVVGKLTVASIMADGW